MEDATDDAFMPVIGPGVKLSMALYHFASPLGSVGEDMKDLGAEVTLFCAIMRQVRAVFVKPKPFRISTTAIDDVHDVLRRGKAIFAKIRALLDRLQNERSTIDVYTRVKHTFSKSKVLMWKESLRSCNAMVQVMLTTMAFAERIATSTGTSTSTSEDDQLRDLMQSLLLAQQSTNARLERLEDQTLQEELQDTETSPSSSSGRLGVNDSSTNRHRRNRSSRAIFDIASEGAIDLLAEGSQRTSVLLNRKISRQHDYRDSQSRTWTSLSERRESVAQSTDLLETWTDQIDPSPPYALSWHGEYAENAYKIMALQDSLEKVQNQTRSAQVSSSASAGDTRLGSVQRSQERMNSENASQLPGRSLSPQTFNQPPDPLMIWVIHSGGEINLVDIGHRPETSRQSPSFAYHIYRVTIQKRVLSNLYYDDSCFYVYRGWSTDPSDYRRVSDAELEEICNDTNEAKEHLFVLRKNADGPPIAEELQRAIQRLRERRQKPPNSDHKTGEREKARLSARSEADDDDDDDDDEKEEAEGIAVNRPEGGRHGNDTSSGTSVDYAKIPLHAPVPGSMPEIVEPRDSNPTVEIFKNFRVSLEDPCWKVLPAALKKYNVVADWKGYALYIVYGDQERCIGLEEKPLVLFKDLDKEGKKPMFMLRKLAAAAWAVDPGLQKESKSPPAPSTTQLQKESKSPPALSTPFPRPGTPPPWITGDENADDKLALKKLDPYGNDQDTDGIPGPKIRPAADSTETRPSLVPLSTTTSPTPDKTPLPHSPIPSDPTTSPLFRRLDVTMGDPCSKVLPLALAKYNIDANWQTYSLWVVHGDEERCIGLEEKPLTIFRDLEADGRKPMFMLRRVVGGKDVDVVKTEAVGKGERAQGGEEVLEGGLI